MIKFYEYLKNEFENIILPIKNLWSSLYSIFGFFYRRNPLTREDKLNFVKSLEDYTTSRFNVSFNSRGMILTNKKDSGLVTVLDN